eukprot:Amastigsp_a679040_84.p2 type:complete len:213 gc:universal Amastigsp_a679040_84:1171-533(-)
MFCVRVRAWATSSSTQQFGPTVCLRRPTTTHRPQPMASDSATATASEWLSRSTRFSARLLPTTAARSFLAHGGAARLGIPRTTLLRFLLKRSRGGLQASSIVLSLQFYARRARATFAPSARALATQAFGPGCDSSADGPVFAQRFARGLGCDCPKGLHMNRSARGRSGDRSTLQGIAGHCSGVKAESRSVSSVQWSSVESKPVKAKTKSIRV